MNTVVLNGNADIELNQSVDVQIVTADASGAVTIMADGDGCVYINGDADADLIVESNGEFGLFTEISQGDMPWYSGATEVTPTQGRQILQTANHALANNIIINPIPSNYGLITWNGAVLTVS